MRTVRDVMRSDIEVLRTTESAADAACFLASREVDSIPLCLADGSLAGTVTTRDIVAKVVAKGRDPRRVPLVELVEPGDVLALERNLPIEEAIAVMCRHQRARLPVVEGDRVVGFVTQSDLAQSLAFVPPWVED
jgi:CBS domain-containing protein